MSSRHDAAQNRIWLEIVQLALDCSPVCVTGVIERLNALANSG
ncbi:hypothetical protein [Streptomyces scopuliridis]